jgi:hypothetical protein
MSAPALVHDNEEAEFDDNYKCGTVHHSERKRSLSVEFGDKEYFGALDAILDINPGYHYEDASLLAAFVTADSPVRRNSSAAPKKAVKKSIVAEERSLESCAGVEAAPARKKPLIQRGVKGRQVVAAAAKPVPRVVQADKAVKRLLHKLCTAAKDCTAQLESNVQEEDTVLYQVLTELCADPENQQRLRKA